ncbi:MAG: hypothetical protein HC908_10115 [Calothrix sp. SM1_7_51]|nr:hypothetical protein [Calothrix sp. SM1_7_51]
MDNSDLFGEEFIPNHEVLRELIGVMLTVEDWETISRVAGDFLSAQIIHQATSEKISA